MCNLLPCLTTIGGFEQSDDIAFAQAATWFGEGSRSVISKRPADTGGDEAETGYDIKCNVHMPLCPMLPAITGGIERFVIPIYRRCPGIVHIQQFTIGYIKRDGCSCPGQTAIMGRIEECSWRILSTRTTCEG